MRKVLFVFAALSACHSAPPPDDDALTPIAEVAGDAPTWKAPPPRADGCPITVRAGRANGRVMLYGWGAPENTGAIMARVRFLDANNQIVSETSYGMPISPEKDKWYRLTRADPMTSDPVEFDKVVAHVTEVRASDARTKTWESDFRWGGFYSWARVFPKTPPKPEAAYPLAMAKLAADLWAKSSVFPRRLVFDYGVYNASDKPWSRADLTLIGSDQQGKIGELSGAWVPLSGNHDIPVLAPKGWGPVHFEAKENIERWQKATQLEIRIDGVEGEGGAKLYAAPKK